MFEPCDCGSGKTYVTCCGRLHAGAPADTAEALMRSRYSAYCRRDVGYLVKSWAVETCPVPLTLDQAQEWVKLDVFRHETLGPDHALVEFKAHWRKGTQTGIRTEVSEFRREGAGWVYIAALPGD